MVCEEAKYALYSFFLGNSLLLALTYPDCGVGLTWITSYFLIFGLLLTVILWFSLSGSTFQVSIRATGLGYFFALGIIIWHLQIRSIYRLYGVYLCTLTFFHFSDYMAIALANPSSLALSSFMLNHSTSYHIAAVLSWLEFFIESYYFPGIKQYWYISLIGSLLCIFGEILRKSAIIIAGINFTHIIQHKKRKEHRLVTNGPFKYCRHPSYVGWFFWSIGTQIIMLNPVCLLGYTLASWRFFNERIEYEEATLINFFGHEYIEYQRKVPTGIPFVKGLLIEKI